MRILKELAHKHRDGRSGREGQHDASHGDDHGMTRLLGDNAVKKVDEDVSKTYDETDNEDMLKEEHQRKNDASEDQENREEDDNNDDEDEKRLNTLNTSSVWPRGTLPWTTRPRSLRT